MRIGGLREERHVVVLREVICVLFEPPGSVLLRREGCGLLEVLLLFKLPLGFKLWVLRFEREASFLFDEHVSGSLQLGETLAVLLVLVKFLLVVVFPTVCAVAADLAEVNSVG